MKLRKLDEKKVQVIDKLVDQGIDTEKKVTSLATDEILIICEKQGMTLSDMHYITELSKAIKNRKTYSFLAGALYKEEGGANGNNRDDKRARDGAGEKGNEDLEDRVKGSYGGIEGDAERLY